MMNAWSFHKPMFYYTTQWWLCQSINDDESLIDGLIKWPVNWSTVVSTQLNYLNPHWKGINWIIYSIAMDYQSSIKWLSPDFIWFWIHRIFIRAFLKGRSNALSPVRHWMDQNDLFIHLSRMVFTLYRFTTQVYMLLALQQYLDHILQNHCIHVWCYWKCYDNLWWNDHGDWIHCIQ